MEDLSLSEDNLTASLCDNVTNCEPVANCSHGNCTICNFTEMAAQWGPQHDPLYISLSVTIALCIVFFIGVVGNIITIIVIVHQKSLHTATNFYLGSLAISDMFLLVTGFPQEIYQTWYKYPYPFGEMFCQIRGMTSEISTNASILTIVAFTIERFVAICYPLTTHTMSQLSRVVRIIIAIWIVAGVAAIPQVLQAGMIYIECNGITYQKDVYSVCSITNPIKFAFEAYTIIFFLLPMCLITVLYVKIGLKLRQQAAQFRSENNAEIHESRKAIFRMLGETPHFYIYRSLDSIIF